MSVWNWLGFDEGPPVGAAPDDALDSIVDVLSHMDETTARYLAAFAYVLGRVAHADSHISDEEAATMKRLVVKHGELSREQATAVVDMAKQQAVLFGATDNVVVTRQLDRNLSRGQKLSLLHCLYAVCAADRHISTEEDNEVRRISTELRLKHSDFIAIRRHYAEHLGVLKPPEPRGAA
jgi:uncharacterized tellurite resistance protein B-like protein